MKNKKKILIAATILMTGTATATTFGTFQQQETKQTGGEPVEYTVGMVNLGQEPLTVNIEASETGLVSLNFEEQVILPPSQVSGNPEGRSWYALGNGSYAEITEYSFTAAARNFRNTSFTLDITAETNNSQGAGSYKQIIQERSYSFTLVNESYSKGLIEFQEGENSSKESQRSTENVTIDSTQNQSVEQNNTGQSTEGSEGLSETTLALMTGLLISTAYILKLVVL